MSPRMYGGWAAVGVLAQHVATLDELHQIGFRSPARWRRRAASRLHADAEVRVDARQLHVIGHRRHVARAEVVEGDEARSPTWMRGRHRRHPGCARDGRPHPSGGRSSLITFNDFSSSNVATMTDYMKLSGVNSDFCVGMQSTSRHAYATEQDCGTDLMKFRRGSRRAAPEPRRRAHPAVHPRRHLPLLAHPGHSAGAQLPLRDRIITQCVRTLYARRLRQYTPGSKSAYNTWYNNKLQRQELIVVGANDGMLHAFHAGNCRPTPAPSTTAPAPRCGPSSRRTWCPSSSATR